MEQFSAYRKPNGAVYELAYSVAKNAIDYAWTFLAIAAVAIFFMWYFKPDEGIDKDEWIEISPNGNGDAISKREVVKETINA